MKFCVFALIGVSAFFLSQNAQAGSILNNSSSNVAEGNITLAFNATRTACAYYAPAKRYTLSDSVTGPNKTESSRLGKQLLERTKAQQIYRARLCGASVQFAKPQVTNRAVPGGQWRFRFQIRMLAKGGNA